MLTKLFQDFASRIKGHKGSPTAGNKDSDPSILGQLAWAAIVAAAHQTSALLFTS